MISPADEVKLAKRMLEIEMAVLLPEEAMLRDACGRGIKGGLFAVLHKADFDRLINDRRPFNEWERRLQWAHLPHGSQLTYLVLGEGEHVRGSGDYLRT